MTNIQDQNTITFLFLLRAGLWEQDVLLSSFGSIDFNTVYRLAKEQTVVGLVAAGIEHIQDMKTSKGLALEMASEILQLELRNKAMNLFISNLIKKLQESGIKAQLVKGQGIAQCYARPLWRACGDVDLLLDSENYNKSKLILLPIAEKVDQEDSFKKHQAFVINGFEVELHGRMPFAISNRVDRVLDKVFEDSAENCDYRIWYYEGIHIPIPNPNNDVIIIFTHFLHHFFIEGVGLRQICDWCRLLWIFRDGIDKVLLKSKLDEMGLLSEWKTFAYMVVQYLGMPHNAMPFYSENPIIKYRARKVLKHILECGNLGHNNDNSYRNRYPRFLSNTITVLRRMKDFAKFFWVFPIDTPVFFITYLKHKCNIVKK